MTRICRGAVAAGILIGAAGWIGVRAQEAPQPQPPHFSTRAEYVRVDALVTNRGTSVAGLTGADFELRDNGVVQKVEVTDASALPVDVSLALDTSSSLEGQRLINLKKAATGLIDSLRKGDRAALVTFTDLVRIQSPLTDDLARVRTAIAGLTAVGRTALRDAAYAALLQNDPQAGRALMVVFTDGQDISSFLSDATLNDAAKRINAVVYSVALEGATNPSMKMPQDPLLEELPRATGGRRLSAEHPEGLRELFAAILEEFRQRYILTYTPEGVDRTGYHTLDVRLIHGLKGEIRARPGYFR